MLWELGEFLHVMTIKQDDMMADVSPSHLLRSDRDTPHIDIADIEYKNIRATTADGEEDTVDMERLLVSYLSGRSNALEDRQYKHFQSLFRSPHLMARIIEDSVGYGGMEKPDSDNSN
jgi:hypothetical protein